MGAQLNYTPKSRQKMYIWGFLIFFLTLSNSEERQNKKTLISLHTERLDLSE